MTFFFQHPAHMKLTSDNKCYFLNLKEASFLCVSYVNCTHKLAVLQ